MTSYMLKNVPDHTWEAITTISERDYITIRGIIIKSLEQYIVVHGEDTPLIDSDHTDECPADEGYPEPEDRQPEDIL